MFRCDLAEVLDLHGHTWASSEVSWIPIGFELIALAEAGAIETIGVYDLDPVAADLAGWQLFLDVEATLPDGTPVQLGRPDRDRLRAELEHDLARFLTSDQTTE